MSFQRVFSAGYKVLVLSSTVALPVVGLMRGKKGERKRGKGDERDTGVIKFSGNSFLYGWGSPGPRTFTE